MKEYTQQLLKNYSIPIKKIILYSFFIGVIIFLLYSISAEIDTTKLFNRHTIEMLIEKSGVFSWFVFILLISLTVLSPLPSSSLVLIGGYLFNPLFTIILTIIGELIGAAGNFYIGRKLGEKIITKRFPKIQKMINKYGNHMGKEVIFFLALIPAGTSNVTGYLCGISKNTFKEYITSWMSGIMILNIVIAFLGYSAKIQSLWLTIGIVLLIGIAILIIRKKNKLH